MTEQGLASKLKQMHPLLRTVAPPAVSPYQSIAQCGKFEHHIYWVGLTECIREGTVTLMRKLGHVLLLTIASLALAWGADDLGDRVRQMEVRGQARAARQALDAAVKAAPRDIPTLTLYAEFLDQRRDPGTAAAYEKLLSVAGANSPAGKLALRRLTALSLHAGDRSAAAKHLSAWQQPGGTGLQLSTSSTAVAEIPTGSI